MEPTNPSPQPLLARGPVTESTATRVSKGQQGSAEAILADIREHLGALRYSTAQQLASEAAIRFPGHAGVRTMNRALNEWTASTSPAEGHDRSEEIAWLRDPPKAARGKWVALVGGEVVAMAKNLEDIVKSLDSMVLPKPPLIHQVG